MTQNMSENYGKIALLNSKNIETKMKRKEVIEIVLETKPKWYVIHSIESLKQTMDFRLKVDFINPAH